MAHSSLSHHRVSSLSSRNAQIAKQGIFQVLFPFLLYTLFHGDAVLPFPACSDWRPGATCPGIWHSLSMGDLVGFLEIWEFSCLLHSLTPVQSSPAFSTAPCRGAHPHFGLWGALLSPNRGVPELVPTGGGAEEQHWPAAMCWVSVQEAISQPVFMCSKTTRAP